jgi:hypothetical protein
MLQSPKKKKKRKKKRARIEKGVRATHE